LEESQVVAVLQTTQAVQTEVLQQFMETVVEAVQEVQVAELLVGLVHKVL
jgi:hypothetical protein